MIVRSSAPPVGSPRSALSVTGAAWLAPWRAFWLDLPLAWAGEIDRFLFRWVPPSSAAPD